MQQYPRIWYWLMMYDGPCILYNNKQQQYTIIYEISQQYVSIFIKFLRNNAHFRRKTQLTHLFSTKYALKSHHLCSIMDSQQETTQKNTNKQLHYPVGTIHWQSIHVFVLTYFSIKIWRDDHENIAQSWIWHEIRIPRNEFSLGKCFFQIFIFNFEVM